MLQFQNYVRAQSLEQAYTLNQNRRARVLGGMLWLRTEGGTAGTAIDLSALGLDTIERTGEGWAIGAMVPLRTLAGPLPKRWLPLWGCSSAILPPWAAACGDGLDFLTY